MAMDINLGGTGVYSRDYFDVGWPGRDFEATSAQKLKKSSPLDRPSSGSLVAVAFLIKTLNPGIRDLGP